MCIHKAGIWETLFAQANVYVQWDPERSINGKKLEHRKKQIITAWYFS
ncbi:DUF4291 family protein [Escherichia coli]|nr:DUF4291 family protein [Escherichia coli]WCE60366.1 hypothetical protein PL330_18920 [Escherichia coli]